MYNKKRYNGFSLVEVMLALLIASTIVSGSFVLLQTSNRILITQRQNNNWLQQKRFLHHLFRAAVHNAGFIGCLNLQHHPLDKHYALRLINLTKPPHPIEQTLNIESLAPNFQIINTNLNKGEQLVYTPEKLHLKSKQDILIANCEHAEMIQIKRKHGKLLFLNTALRYHFAAPIFIGSLIQYSFYTRKDGKNIDLYLSKGNKRGEEVMSDVKSITYKITNSGLLLLSIHNIRNKSYNDSFKIMNQ